MKTLSLGCLVLWIGSLISLSGQTTSVEQLIKEEEAQDDALRTDLTVGTFESSRLIAGRSVETSKKRSLDLRISHRFSRIDGGLYEFFGLDNASVKVGLDYGITDRLTVGFGRSSWDKEYDFPVTYRILRQSTGRHTMPVSVTVMGGWMIRTLKDPEGDIPPLGDMSSTALQLLIARKFSNIISAQIMPIWIHYVKTPQEGDPNDIFSPGVGGSIRIFKRVRFNAEYYPLFSGDKLGGTVSPFSVGFDIQTGGHVFQLFIGNATGTNERLLVTQTTDRWDKGQLHVGFNILRVFPL